jgi:hypothetical protein
MTKKIEKVKSIKEKKIDSEIDLEVNKDDHDNDKEIPLEKKEQEKETKKKKKEKDEKKERKTKVIGSNEPPKPKTKTKIISSLTNVMECKPIPPKNIILHLKCSLREIEEYIRSQKWKLDSFTYDPAIPQEIQSFEPSHTSFSYFQMEHGEEEKKTYVDTEEQDDDFETKLKYLKIQFYKNIISEDKKSDCFWCTCPFDNPTCYILQNGTDDTLFGHGSFCTPECSVAYLFKNMNWDDSVKMESYQLINHYYGKTNKYTESIKPACSPYYFLDKYYGSLTIQEYRKLSKSSHIFLTVEKPVTRIFPEIHEDNDKNNQNQTAIRGTYKVKKQSEKMNGPSRNSILRDNFGLAQL